MEKVIPTRSALRRIKENLKIAKDGYSLLEKKREALMSEFMREVAQMQDIYAELREKLRRFYSQFRKGAVSLGQDRSELFFLQSKATLEIDVRFRSIMGVKVPSLQISERNVPRPGLAFSTLEMDRALAMVEEIQDLLVRYVEKRYIVDELAREIKRTQRRVNALEVFFIPSYTATKKWIEDVLEENDREMFTRQKKVKDVLARKRSTGEA